jgi:tRNA 2-thiouridine synthesizing protein A
LNPFVPPQLLDVRGLLCPLPLIRARLALATLPAGETLVVLATDPEAPIDLAALAADSGLVFSQQRLDGSWRLTLAPSSTRKDPPMA